MKHAAWLLALAMVLCGCAEGPYQPTFIPGRIVSLSDGKVIPAQAEVTSGSGKLTATDPATGEIFDGSYRAIQETTVSQVSRPGFLGIDDDVGQEVKTSDVAQASGILVGNKGTVINIKMTVKAGNPPIAYGEATDNNGKKYNVQF